MIKIKSRGIGSLKISRQNGYLLPENLKNTIWLMNETLTKVSLNFLYNRSLVFHTNNFTSASVDMYALGWLPHSNSSSGDYVSVSVGEYRDGTLYVDHGAILYRDSWNPHWSSEDERVWYIVDGDITDPDLINYMKSNAVYVGSSVSGYDPSDKFNKIDNDKSIKQVNNLIDSLTYENKTWVFSQSLLEDNDPIIRYHEIENLNDSISIYL